MINWSLLIESLPQLAKAAVINCEIALLAFGIGFALSIPLALMERSEGLLPRTLASVYCWGFRGTPMIVQILFVFYVLPQFGILIPAFLAVSVAIGFNSAAYLSQTIQAGLNAIPSGQARAAQCLGLNTWQSYKYIILPQCFRNVLPSLGNEAIVLLKDSSLASVVGLMEIVKTGAAIRGRTFEAFTVLLGVACIYLVLTGLCTLGVKQLESWSKQPCSL